MSPSLGRGGRILSHADFGRRGSELAYEALHQGFARFVGGEEALHPEIVEPFVVGNTETRQRRATGESTPAPQREILPPW